jgi:hypothetical protein
MPHDRRRPAQPQPIIDPTERLMLRLSTYPESKPASKADAARMAAEVVERLRRGGFDCEVLVDTPPDGTPRRLH